MMKTATRPAPNAAGTVSAASRSSAPVGRRVTVSGAVVVMLGGWQPGPAPRMGSHTHLPPPRRAPTTKLGVLRGGAGRDRALGGPGRDGCTAEREKTCER